MGQQSLIRLSCALALVSLVTGGGGQERRVPVPEAGRRVALVVGNDAYATMPLRNAVNDATAMAAALRDLGFAVEPPVLNATRAVLERAVEAFVARVQPGDVTVFYYAGHAIQLGEEGNYLVPVDFQAQDEVDARDAGYRAQKVVDKLKLRGARLRVLILDACRNNPFSERRAAGGGLAEMRAAEGDYIAFAAAPGRSASDNAAAGNGLFTSQVLRALKEPGLGLDALFRRVRQRVHETSRGQQLPYTSDGTLGEFFFRPPGANGAATGGPPPSVPGIVPPSPSGLDLKDLQEQVKVARQWSEYQALMASDFGKAQEFEAQAAPAELKAVAWERFLQTYAQDNPLSTEDESLRGRAQEAARGWRAEAANVAQVMKAPSRPAAPLGAADVASLSWFAEVARRNSMAVVNISTPGSTAGKDPWSRVDKMVGSGFIIDPVGYVLTNRHVVSGAPKLDVALANGRRYEGKVVGEDARTDLALLKIEPLGGETLAALGLGDSDRAEVGEWVMAVGNPFGVGGSSVAHGVVSQVGRPLSLGGAGAAVPMIQTSAAINSANSGGPLLGSRGEVLGINTFVVSSSPGALAGAGFAVPINLARDALPEVKRIASVAPSAPAATTPVAAPGAVVLESSRSVIDSATAGVVTIGAAGGAALGSGFVIDKHGYILTSRHIVLGRTARLIVTLANGTQQEAAVVGTDARTDVALLKMASPGTSLTALPLGDSDRAQVGEWVMALGRTVEARVEPGVVSYTGRALALGAAGTSVDMIQTDATIAPGNSGGPLIDTRGAVIGINTLVRWKGGKPMPPGFGFAVPINVAKAILPQLRERGKVVRGWLGVQTQAVGEDMARTIKGLGEGKGAIVTDVTKGGPAEKAGVRTGDVIVTADGIQVADNTALSRYVASKSPGTTIRLVALRSGDQRTLSVTLGTFPED